MTVREPAWRVFAAELAASTVEERDAGDRTPTFLVSPFGARISRALLLGVLDPPESGAGSSAFLRSRLRDPTGEVAVTAGSYQPGGMTGLQRIDSPTPVLAVGKAHWTGRAGESRVPALRVEGIRPLTEAELRAEYARSLRQAIARLRLRLAVHPNDPLREGANPPTPPAWLAAGREAVLRYPNVDVRDYHRRLSQVLELLEGNLTLTTRLARGPPTPAGPPRGPAPGASVTRTPPGGGAPAPPSPSAAERAEESAFLDDVDEICESSVDGYAELKVVFDRCARRGVTESRAEEILNRLEGSGALEEPIVGRVRRA